MESSTSRPDLVAGTPDREPVSLPTGSKLLDVEGVPVALVPTAEGGLDSVAFDGPPRRFPMDSAFRNGSPVPPDRFASLISRSQTGWGQALCQNLNVNIWHIRPTEMKPDLVGGTPDGSVVTVIGFDGFAAVRLDGAWTGKTGRWLSDPDLDSIDGAEALALSSEARKALPDVPDRGKPSSQAPS